MKKTIVLMTAIICLCSCDFMKNEKEGMGTVRQSNGYIGAYFSPKSLQMKKFSNSGGESFINIYQDGYDYFLVGESAYKRISEYYNDIGYDTTFRFLPYVSDPEKFLSDEIASINIVSTAEYNGIPAGENLNNQFYLYAMSMYPFIQSGYTDKFDYASEYAPSIFLEMQEAILQWTNNPSAYLGSPVYGTVDEIDVESLKLIGGSNWKMDLMFLLQMKQIPVNPEGELIVTVGFKDGKQLEARGLVYDLIN